MDTNLYIRHAIGSRLLLDCQKQNLSYEIAFQDNHWNIMIRNVNQEAFELLRANERELNIFVQDRDGKKHWYYASEIPVITYNEDNRSMLFVVNSKMSY